MPKLTRRRLLCATAPLAAAPLGLAIARSGDARRGSARSLHPPLARLPQPERLDGPRGDDRRGRAGSRRAERPRRPPLPAARAAVLARSRPPLHAGRDRRGARDRARRLLPRLDVQRHDPGPGDPGDRRRPPARALRQRRLAPAHDPLPRDPPDGHGRRLRDRDAGGRAHVRVPRAAGGLPPLPLPLDPAQEAHPQGALRRLHHRPEEHRARPPRSS